jgi:hypothetical protein
MDLDRMEDLMDFMLCMKEVNASRAFVCYLIHGRDDVCHYHVFEHHMMSVENWMPAELSGDNFEALIFLLHDLHFAKDDRLLSSFRWSTLLC